MEVFDRLADELGVKKYKVLETMIEVFAALDADSVRPRVADRLGRRRTHEGPPIESGGIIGWTCSHSDF